jgi:hypothetical protein
MSVSPDSATQAILTTLHKMMTDSIAMLPLLGAGVVVFALFWASALARNDPPLLAKRGPPLS